MICASCRREIAEYSNFCYYCGVRQPASPPPRPAAEKRLMRSSTDVRIAGVCAGIAEYFNADPTLVRVVWLILVLLPVPIVPAVLGYIAAWIIMPKAPLPAATAQPVAPQTTHAPQSS